MATPFIGKSTPKQIGSAPLYSKTISSTGLKTGAAVVADDATENGNMVKAPTGAHVAKFAGLIATEYLVGGASVAGQDVQLQRTGIGMGILDAGNAVAVGDQLVISDVDGSLRPYAGATDEGAEIVGTSEDKLGSQGVNTPIRVNLDMKGPVHQTNA